MVHAKETFLTQPVTEELQLPAFALPYYEGFNKSGNGYWLGIYRREETFPVSFLKEACLICMQTKIGQLYTTPWKSLIIKGIDPAGRRLWDLLLGKYRINVRHASNELNWQVENLSEESLALKRFIIRQFDREDVRTFGLSFAIKTDPRTRAFGSIVIRKKAHPGGSRVFDKYDLLYTPDFNPNAGGLVLFRDGVPKEALGVYLVSLCKYYYEQQNSDDLLHHIYRQQESLEAPADAPVVLQHQCMHCLTLYDTETGEPDQGIAPGTPFEALSYSYRCPLCDAGKEDFISIVRKSSLDGVGVRT
jgi:rubredoxin